nr:MAG TPA: hypothetical protein [Caudoviricetes sp.]
MRLYNVKQLADYTANNRPRAISIRVGRPYCNRQYSLYGW